MIEILSDDYDTNEMSVKLKTKTGNGVTYTTKGVLSGKDNAMNGRLSVKYLDSGMPITNKWTIGGYLARKLYWRRQVSKG